MVKMKHTKVLALVAISMMAVLAAAPVLAKSPSQVNAKTGVSMQAAEHRAWLPMKAQVNTHSMNRSHRLSVAEEIPDYDEAEIDALLKEYEAVAEPEDETNRPKWILFARGFSWEHENEASVDDAAPEERIRAGMRLAIKVVLSTEDFTIFKVVRGVVGNDGERHRVEGYGILFNEERFFVMKLQGEEFELKAIGRVYGARWGVKVAMKGKMSANNTDYGFQMRGRAWRIRPRLYRPVPEEAEPSLTP
jgi:hypothetical protein